MRWADLDLAGSTGFVAPMSGLVGFVALVTVCVLWMVREAPGSF